MIRDDAKVIGELAKRYADLAALPENGEREARIRRVNGLKPERPPVWINEIPWNEMDIDNKLVLRCEDTDARRIEDFLRKNLFRWEYFRADMVLPRAVPVCKAMSDTGCGLSADESTIAFDPRNHIVSHEYHDQLDNDAKLDALTCPVISADPDADARNLSKARELLGDALPAELKGYLVYHAPWDQICVFRGVTPVLTDLAERPDFMHRTIARFTGFYTARTEAMEKLGLLEARPSDIHCTPPFTDDLPGAGHAGGPAKLSEVWFRGMAQLFGSISPDMHEEFDLAYMRGLMGRCGLSYYGCCEALDRFIPRLKTVANMRKIGVSPWADEISCAEQIGADYVYSKKPNPALVAGSFDARAVRDETRRTAEACLRNGCPYEMVLKDISTVTYKPQNLIAWNDTVRETLDEFYGRG